MRLAVRAMVVLLGLAAAGPAVALGSVPCPAEGLALARGSTRPQVAALRDLGAYWQIAPDDMVIYAGAGPGFARPDLPGWRDEGGGRGAARFRVPGAYAAALGAVHRAAPGPIPPELMSGGTSCFGRCVARVVCIGEDRAPVLWGFVSGSDAAATRRIRDWTWRLDELAVAFGAAIGPRFLPPRGNDLTVFSPLFRRTQQNSPAPGSTGPQLVWPPRVSQAAGAPAVPYEPGRYAEGPAGGTP